MTRHFARLKLAGLLGISLALAACSGEGVTTVSAGYTEGGAVLPYEEGGYVYYPPDYYYQPGVYYGGVYYDNFDTFWHRRHDWDRDHAWREWQHELGRKRLADARHRENLRDERVQERRVERARQQGLEQRREGLQNQRLEQNRVEKQRQQQLDVRREQLREQRLQEERKNEGR